MRFFSNYTWRFTTNKKQIYLTFDDGPTPKITPFVLSELKKHNAKATFFCIGKNIENHPHIFKQIIDEGHTIGNHTHNHLNGWENSTKIYLQNIQKTAKIINSKLTTYNSQLFRPPYGKIKSAQAKELQKLGYKIILWDVLSADFDTTINHQKCTENVLKNTQNGSIIVFHDSVKASKKLYATLPKVLAELSKKGYEFLAI